MTGSAASTHRGHDEHPRPSHASWLESAWHDLRYALRGLRRKPGFTAAIVLTLGLGLGANATMFGVVDRLLFRPPAYMAAPDRVHRVYLATTYEREGERFGSNMSYKRYIELTAWARTVDRTAAFFAPQLAVGVGDRAREMRVAAVSASFWDLFDARPALGRFFTAAEDQVPDGTPVAVLGYGYWQAVYGGRASVIGSKIDIGSRIYTIIGVAPPRFFGMAMESPPAFIPITASAKDLFGGGFRARADGGRPRPTYYDSHNMSWMEMLVRRRPGVSQQALDADLTSAYRRSYAEAAATSPGMRPITLARPHVIAASALRERGPNESAQSKVALWLVGVAGIVLLVACANVGNLLLARAFSRRREIAVRLALGVGRGRLLRQLLTESLVLAALGALAGIAIAQWGGGILRATLIENVDWGSTFTDRRILLFTGVAAVAAGLLTGLAPALHAGRGDIASTLKAGAREGTYQRSRTRVVLLVLQAALSVVLLVGAGLFVRSLRNARTVDLGYDAERVLFVSLEMRGITLPEERDQALRHRVVERAGELPFVEHASVTTGVPFWMTMVQDLYVPGIDSVSRLGQFVFNAVSPDYFATMGTRILRGRPIRASDTKTSERVIVVSESMARSLWSKKEALGQCVKVGADTVPCSAVVGIAQDIKRGSLDKEDGLQYYVPAEQMGAGSNLFVRTRGDAAMWGDRLRRELQKEMPGASYVTVVPLSEILGGEMRSWTLGATMFSVFGGLALVLAALGLYSVIAYNVAQRTHELGVRVALGAQSRDLLGLVVGEGIRLAVLGLAIGLAVALAAGRYVGPLLFGVRPRDPWVFGAVAGLLLAVAVLASVIPAWRASRVDPSVALRAD
jgi:predicted permease